MSRLQRIVVVLTALSFASGWVTARAVMGGERIRTATIEGIGMWWDSKLGTYIEDVSKEPVIVNQDSTGRLYLERTPKAAEISPWGEPHPAEITTPKPLADRPTPVKIDRNADGIIIDGVVVSEAEAGMLHHLNSFRKRVGLAPLVITEKLMQRARGHAQWMARNNSMTHSSGIQENIAMGQRSPTDVTNTWINSSGHNANMRTAAKEAGVAMAVGSNGTRFWCQQFATGSDRWGEAPIANTVRAAENTVRAGVSFVRRGFFGRRRG